MKLIDADSFRTLISDDQKQDAKLPNVLYIKPEETDESPSTSNITAISEILSDSIIFLSLESVQNGTLPELPTKEALYILCEHGHISELAALYLDISGFETVNIEGGLKALEALCK